MAHLAVARLWFCSNSFTPQRTRAADLLNHEWTNAQGRAADTLPGRAVGSELDGVRRFVAARHDWQVTVLRSASAPTGGPLSAEVFGAWMSDVEDGLRRGRFDGVYLSLHGACQAEGDPSADLTILRRVRAIMGHTPVVASFDMRANLSEETAILLDGASANRAWPSGGGDDAAIRALTMLEGILAGAIRPVGALARVPTVLPDIFLREAMGELWRDELTRVPQGVLDASVHFGFAWGDSPYAGPSALVWSDRDAGLARETAARLAISLVRWRTRALPELRPPEQALAPLLAARIGNRPGILLDPSDDLAAGGLGDTPAMLRALINADAQLPGQVAVAALHDAGAVQAAQTAGKGGTIKLALCGRATTVYGAPILLTLQVIALAETSQAGATAIVRAGRVDILITTARPSRVTPDLLAAAGMRPALYALLALKAGEIARVEFADAGGPVHACACAGPTNPDLTRLPFHYVPPRRRSNAAPPQRPDLAPPDITAMRDTSAGLGLRPKNASMPSSAIEQSGAEQTQQRHEDRRANAQQKRADPLGTQRRQVGVQP
jgi:microcystin degradation protein MlrC